MPPRDPRAFLADIRDACRGILTRTKDKSLKDYETDESLRLICERLLSIAGEAVSQLRIHAAEFVPGIDEANRIVGFRNILIHGYYTLVNEIVWTIIEVDVPRLLADAERLMESTPEQP